MNARRSAGVGRIERHAGTARHHRRGVLLGHQGVAEVAVVAREAEPGERHLVAYVVRRTTKPAVRELRRFLSDRLPAYMVPATFTFVDALPRTAAARSIEGPFPDWRPRTLRRLSHLPGLEACWA